jgi:hypothetical protein
MLGYYKTNNRELGKDSIFVPCTEFLLIFLVAATLSGVGRSMPHVFDSLESTVLYKKPHHPQDGRPYSQRTPGVDVVFVYCVNACCRDRFNASNWGCVGR